MKIQGERSDDRNLGCLDHGCDNRIGEQSFRGTVTRSGFDHCICKVL